MSPPSSIGHYKIVSKLGEGGMGAVYRATDTRLNRDVAIKILPPAFADDAARMQRFEREAQLLAAISHPNIAAIYSVEQRAIVMELVAGENLRGPLPLETAMDYARQIAVALEAAHERGIIHRDLKPANVKVTPEGQVKLLDFGLAKSSDTAAASSPAGPTVSPTISLGMTQAGTILGTAAYMAPEQARGADVDKRADIWAFGCVLYEMLTGKRAFEGQSTTDVLAAVIRAEPDWTALPAATPESVLRLLKRCLEKDRKRRLPDIGVARIEIDDARLSPEPDRQPRRAARIQWPVIFAAFLVLAAAAGLWWAAARAPARESWTGLMLGGPAKAFQPRLSPDGQLLAFLSIENQLGQLGVMKPNGGSWTILTHDREHGYIATIAWAPDGSRIYFDRLWGEPVGVYSIPPLGGDPRLVLEDAFGPEPLADGSLIVLKMTGQGDEQLFHYWPDSGKLDPLPAFMPQTDITPMLRAVPNGKEVVYYGTRGGAGRSQTARLLILDLATQQARELAPGLSLGFTGSGWAPLGVAPDGKSVYLLGSHENTRELFQIAWQGGKPRAVLSFPDSAPPVAMDAARDGSLYVDQLIQPALILRVSPAGGVAEEFALPQSDAYNTMVSTTGDMLIDSSSWGLRRLAAIRPGGEPRLLVETSQESGLPATIFGDNVAFVLGTGDQRRIAVASLRDGHIFRRFSARSDGGLAALPDGKTLYYTLGGTVWAQAVEGGEPRRISEGIDVVIDPSGRYLYVKRSHKGRLALYRVPAGGGTAEELPLPPRYHIAEPALSSSAVDSHGRILVTVISGSFYYKTAILDPEQKKFSTVPISIEGDAVGAGWTPDGRILARGQRYFLTLWRYRKSMLSR